MKNVLPGIYSWSRFNEEKQMDFNGHVIQLSDNEILLIDPPQTDDATIAEISAFGTVAAIVITNRDHLRDAKNFREHFAAPIWGSDLDAPLMNITLDHIVRGGDTLLKRFTVIALEHMKSPGEFAMHDPVTRSMIIGDAVIGKVPGKLNLLAPEKVPRPLDAKKSLRKLLQFDFDHLVIGDGTSIINRGKTALGEFLE